jgi:hypothetical protein
MSTDALDNDSDLENAAERTADRTGDAAERTSDKTKDVAEDAKQGAGNVLEKTSDAVKRMTPGDSDNDGN